MQSYEYRVVPAPRRPARVKGLRKPQERFARTVEGEMNRLAQDGWEFVRSDTLPCEQKQGWFSRPVTVFETMLVFRRPLAQVQAEGHDLPHASATMPPPVALTPPAFVAAPAVDEEPPPAPVFPLLDQTLHGPEQKDEAVIVVRAEEKAETEDREASEAHVVAERSTLEGRQD